MNAPGRVTRLDSSERPSALTAVEHRTTAAVRIMTQRKTARCGPRCQGWAAPPFPMLNAALSAVILQVECHG